jgi:hypothetical protein
MNLDPIKILHNKNSKKFGKIMKKSMTIWSWLATINFKNHLKSIKWLMNSKCSIRSLKKIKILEKINEQTLWINYEFSYNDTHLSKSEKKKILHDYYFKKKK